MYMKNEKTNILTGKIKNLVGQLLDWINENNLTINNKLPSMLKLSQLLGSSTNSIHLAVKYLVENGVLTTDVGSGTYIQRLTTKSEIFKSASPPPKKTNVALVMNSYICNLYKSNLESLKSQDYWYYSLLKSIRSYSKNYNFTLKPISIPAKYYTKPSPKEVASIIKEQSVGIDALIVFPIYKVNEIINDIYLPIIHINQPDINTTYNFVSPDYYDVSRKVGLIISRIPKITKIWAFIRTSDYLSDFLRVKGLQEGLRFSEKKLDIEKIIDVHNSDYDSAFKAVVKAIADDGEWPHFIYTSGGQMAKAIIDYSKKCGLKPGKDLMLIASSNLKELATYDPPISNTPFQMEDVGKTAIEMIHQIITTGQHVIPARTIPTPIILKDTTFIEAKEMYAEIETTLINIYHNNFV